MSIDPSSILLTDRVAVVTGGGSGIGRGIAAGLAAFGAKVAIWEQNPETCASSAEDIGALGIPTDVRSSDDVDAAMTQTRADLGVPTILVNNAGGTFWSSMLDTSENGWDALYKANLRHVLLCTQRVAQAMVDDGGGGPVGVDQRQEIGPTGTFLPPVEPGVRAVHKSLDGIQDGRDQVLRVALLEEGIGDLQQRLESA
jgi:NAD(P)-dependent dehydrogenase (short-subunit alcohol dehydrogenase family)